MNLFLKRLGGFYKYRFLMEQLVTKDIKLKYRRSFLGYLWSILNPLMVMVIMVIVFSNMFRSDITNFPVYLIIGQTLYNFMSESTTQAIFSIIGNASLLKKTYVPKYVFVMSRVCSSLINLMASCAALFLIMIGMRAELHWTMLLSVVPLFLLVVLVCRVVPNVFFLFIPVILLQEYLFCLGLGMLLAQGCVFFRDIQHIYNAVLTAWMYLTPLFYPITLLPEALRKLVMTLNPMYFYITQFRQIVLECRMPGIALLVGVGAFLKTQDKFILYI